MNHSVNGADVRRSTVAAGMAQIILLMEMFIFADVGSFPDTP